MEEEKLNTIYVMSKGRPACTTAQMLTDTGYPGEWFIVCGDNDETLGDYKKRWGEKRVLVFNWREWVDKVDLLDPFGVDGGMPSGAVPARNAIQAISKERGEKRHWQFDDDFAILYGVDDNTSKKIRIEDGAKLQWYLNRIAEFGYRAGLTDIGLDGATLFVTPESKRKAARQVFCCHNLRSDDGFLPWRGRMADDIVQALETDRTSFGIQLSLKWIGYPYTQSAKETGGNTDLYNSEGYIRKAGYAILVCPSACRVRFDSDGHPHLKMNYPAAKILNQKYKK